MNTLDIPSKEKKKKMNTLDNSLLDFGILIVGLIGFFFFFCGYLGEIEIENKPQIYF